MNKHNQKKNRNWIILVILLGLLAAVLIWALRPADPASDPVLHPGSPSVPESQPTAQSTEPALFPLELAEDLVVTDAGNYSGIFMEDGSNEVVTDVLMIILKNENEFLEKARFYDSSGKYLRVDHTKEIEKYTKRNDELDKYIQILFEQNAKGKIPESTYDKMMEKYIKEKNLIKDQIRELTIQEQNEINSSNHLSEAQLLINSLKEITEENVLETKTLRTFVKWITIKTTKKEYHYNSSETVVFSRQFLHCRRK